MTQPSLFDPRPIEAPRRPPVSADLTRVRGTIGAAIRDFCRARLGGTFHAAELREYVARSCGPAAPDSAGRILRELRKDGVVSYVVEDRSASLYRVTGVEA